MTRISRFPHSATGAVAALLAVLLAPVVVCAPAGAARAVIVDGDDSPALADLLRIKVKNGNQVVRVRLTFDDLVRQVTRAGQSVGVFLDTERGRPGPEFGLGGGLNYGTDYQLARMRRWTWVGGRPLLCAYDGEIDWGKDTATYTIDAECLGDYTRLRVAVEVGEHDGSKNVSDWLLGEKEFARWVDRG